MHPIKFVAFCDEHGLSFTLDRDNDTHRVQNTVVISEHRSPILRRTGANLLEVLDIIESYGGASAEATVEKLTACKRCEFHHLDPYVSEESFCHSPDLPQAFDFFEGVFEDAQTLCTSVNTNGKCPYFIKENH